MPFQQISKAKPGLGTQSQQGPNNGMTGLNPHLISQVRPHIDWLKVGDNIVQLESSLQRSQVARLAETPSMDAIFMVIMRF